MQEDQAQHQVGGGGGGVGHAAGAGGLGAAPGRGRRSGTCRRSRRISSRTGYKEEEEECALAKFIYIFSGRSS